MMNQVRSAYENVYYRTVLLTMDEIPETDEKIHVLRALYFNTPYQIPRNFEESVSKLRHHYTHAEDIAGDDEKELFRSIIKSRIGGEITRLSENPPHEKFEVLLTMGVDLAQFFSLPEPKQHTIMHSITSVLRLTMKGFCWNDILQLSEEHLYFWLENSETILFFLQMGIRKEIIKEMDSSFLRFLCEKKQQLSELRSAGIPLYEVLQRSPQTSMDQIAHPQKTIRFYKSLEELSSSLEGLEVDALYCEFCEKLRIDS